MEVGVRNNVPLMTAVLSIVALALVFSAALQAIPTALLPPASDALFAVVPHFNAAVSVLAIVAIAAGWRFVRRGDVRRHRAAMLSAFGLFAVFLVFYLYRVAHEGPASFQGPEGFAVAYYVFLLVHIALAILCIPLLFYALLLAVTRPVSEIYGTTHAKVGRVAASLWLISFAMGIVVYLLQHVVYG